MLGTAAVAFWSAFFKAIILSALVWRKERKAKREALSKQD